VVDKAVMIGRVSFNTQVVEQALYTSRNKKN